LLLPGLAGKLEAKARELLLENAVDRCSAVANALLDGIFKGKRLERVAKLMGRKE